jgi:cytochrome b561
VHFLGANVIGALIVVHVGAALHHLLARQDHVFWRMWPSRG